MFMIVQSRNRLRCKNTKQGCRSVLFAEAAIAVEPVIGAAKNTVSAVCVECDHVSNIASWRV